MSTRLIGGVIMTHGDDDGLRLPPAIAPRQIVIVPMLRDKLEDKELLDYCDALEKELKAAGIRGARRHQEDRSRPRSAGTGCAVVRP